jgi:Cu-processing system ATP-binding protein
MIVAKNVTKKFGKVYALNNVSVTCNKGESIALIGPNASGKTTLIKCILHMVVPEKGTISFDNNSIAHNWLYRNRIGYMPQIGRYPENMTIGQVFNLMRDIRKPNGAADEELIKSFSLETIKQIRMRTLSGGTRQKVSASLAFLFNPDVLILDEPTAGLDPVSSEIFKEKIIKEKSKGKLIIITSHILSELDDLVTDVIYMQEGKLNFKKSLITLKQETGEQRLSKAVARVMTTLNQ